MSNKELLIIIVLAAVLLGGTSLSGFFAQEPQDSYYNYVPSATSTVQPGVPITFQVKLMEKGAILTDCDRYGMNGRISPDTAHFCSSFTYLNARSIRVSLDDQEVVNFAAYPLNSASSLSTPLPYIGPVSCYGAISPCSVTRDQENNHEEWHRAYLFGKSLPPQTSLNNTILFTLVVPQNLTAGMHTVEVAYFAETTAHANDNTISPEYLARVGGQQYGNQNEKLNHIERFSVNVSGSPVPSPPIVPITNYTPPVPAPQPNPQPTPIIGQQQSKTELVTWVLAALIIGGGIYALPYIRKVVGV